MYLLLLLLWFIFNGRVTLEVALFGIVICGWLYWFICKYMGYSFQREKVLVKNIPLYLKYAFVLLWEIFKANVDVIKIIFSPKKAEIQPALVRFHTDLKSEASLVALANSITLTPGTVTVRQEGEDYLVLCLNKAHAADIPDWSLTRLLRKMEGPEWN